MKILILSGRIRNGMVAIILSFVSLSFTTHDAPIIVQGMVLDADTGKPIEGAHVYIVHGEEEAMTNKRGEFKIETWQAIPIKITIDRRGYTSANRSVRDAADRPVIRLRSRN